MPLGFEAQLKENLALDDVELFTANGDPVIALAQVWRSEKGTAKSAAEDWDDGHYIVILGVDEDYVYFRRPLRAHEQGFHAPEDIRRPLASGRRRRPE